MALPAWDWVTIEQELKLVVVGFFFFFLDFFLLTVIA
jgi:hypothetical protein